MSDNIYSAPLSNVESIEEERGNPAKAIFIGLLISMIGTVIGAMFVGVAFGVYWGATGKSPDDIARLTNSDTSILIAFLLESAIFSIWSGHYVAKKTNHNEYKNCIIMVLIGTLLGVILMVSMPETYSTQPVWYTITSYIYYPIVVIIGCWLYVKSKK